MFVDRFLNIMSRKGHKVVRDPHLVNKYRCDICGRYFYYHTRSGEIIMADESGKEEVYDRKIRCKDLLVRDIIL